MDFIEMLQKRRSCRRFEPRAVERAKIDAILRAALTAPSSKNTRSTRFAVVEDRATLEKISAMRTNGSAFLKDAPMAVAVMADASLTDLWVDNCAISATTLQYAAASEGLGSCWVHVHNRPHNDHNPEDGTAEEYLHTFLPVPHNFRILCIVALGYPADAPRPRPEHDDADKVFFI